MAPIAVDATEKLEHIQNLDFHVRKSESQVTKEGVVKVSEDQRKASKYPEFLPSWDPNQKYPALKPFKHKDRAFDGDSNYKNLFPNGLESIAHSNLTPKLGTEIKDPNFQLSQLTDAQKNDLALLVERRGVVVFRDQDFKDKGPAFAKQWGSYFGPLHIHPTSGAPEGFPELHITYRKSNEALQQKLLESTTNTIAWHSDVTYELQPPGVTAFVQLDGPNTGGDTIFVDCVEAYERLSPTFQKMLDGLKVIHSSVDQANDSAKNGGIERRAHVNSIHPLVRYHPVLKKKCLFIHRNFPRKIVGLKEQESENLMNYLITHIESLLDAQVRGKYEPGTVVLWDNRRVLHSAVFDWFEPTVRHCFRITPQAERPVASEEEFNDWSVEKEEESLKEAKRILNRYGYE
ncbi:hypothetical protein PACTADRAFT_43257 [Pachysolen tannophilus NRRL Y-2460]|uniref:TauD/TfdA-like domain-containing protein n=1 Tax=Pachysolen tannophilus NRRL Y-2460 TaxID=669874 RepID=A0A1E4TT28_PACTA|nr:hypothetical protein PACTADRAFT_43257 [Pachysolen tannophilus NRRL Y-2460]